jgi:DNA-binding PadR family transcriptional regulator
MQHLRGAGWVKSMGYSPRIIANLIRKGWVECQQARRGRTYRLTELGLQAMKTPLSRNPRQVAGRDRAEGEAVVFVGAPASHDSATAID